VTPGYESITRRLLDFDDNLAGLGMRSTMYKYQRRSVTAMIQKEMDLSDIPDPLFIPLTSMSLETFYLQPGTMEILRDRPTVAACRSGILCEELGELFSSDTKLLLKSFFTFRDWEDRHDFSLDLSYHSSNIFTGGVHC
jgi:hypothetical protein